MEYCEGVNVGDIPEESEGKFEPFKRDISRKVTRLYSDMIFLHGYVHCDPHPGIPTISFSVISPVLKVFIRQRTCRH